MSNSIKKLQCLEGTNSLYVELSESGYVTNPCCYYKAEVSGDSPTVNNIEELLSNPTIEALREKFKDDWKSPSCITCVRNEELGEISLRMYSLMNGYGKKIFLNGEVYEGNWANGNMNGYDGVVRKWDIRPGNTCNLKCAMCCLKSSSKWVEDIDILKKYGNEYNTNYNKGDFDFGHKREDLDFDWIYSQCVDTAGFIYIAGGEPFYMKNVYNFLNKLSKHEWNCNNTTIQTVTNGVSNTPKMLDILSKFKKVEFCVSIDGWEKVNEIIRFPTNHNEFVKNTDELMQLNPQHIYFNITVQCMNLPNIDELVSNIKDRWIVERYELFNLQMPRQLSINNLKPQVIERVLETTKLPKLKKFCSEYKYDENLNKTMQNYLLDLDKKRQTNSKEVLGWCFE